MKKGYSLLSHWEKRVPVNCYGFCGLTDGDLHFPQILVPGLGLGFG